MPSWRKGFFSRHWHAGALNFTARFAFVRSALFLCKRRACCLLSLKRRGRPPGFVKLAPFFSPRLPQLRARRVSLVHLFCSTQNWNSIDCFHRFFSNPFCRTSALQRAPGCACFDISRWKGIVRRFCGYAVAFVHFSKSGIFCAAEAYSYEWNIPLGFLYLRNSVRPKKRRITA